jgi:hypothetical protein
MYEALLGSGWERLPEAVRAIHAPGTFRGRFAIRRGAGPAAGVAAWLCGFPAAGDDVSVELVIARQGERFVWRRCFGGVVVTTWQRVETGTLREGFGPIRCDFELVAREDGLDFVQRAAWLALGPRALRLPGWLAPRVHGRVCAAGDRVRVEVEIAAPVCGCVLAYAGEVRP